MPVVIKRRYRKRNVIGGAGLFDTLSGFVKRLVTSNAAKQISATGFSASKDDAKEIGKKAIDVDKLAAIDVGERAVNKVASKLFSPKNQEEIIQKTRDILAGLSAQVLSAVSANPSVAQNANLNNIIMESGAGAISIKDLGRTLNGAGIKVE